MSVQGDFTKVYFLFEKMMGISRCIFGKYKFLLKNDTLFLQCISEEINFFLQKKTLSKARFPNEFSSFFNFVQKSNKSSNS